MIAIKEFGDRFRSGWVIACVLVWLGAIGLTSFFGLIQVGQIGVQGYERTVVSLLNLTQYLVPLLALLLGHDLIVSENEERTLRLLLASGAGKGRLLLGKLAGGCLTLVVPLVLGFVIAGTAIGFAARDSAFAPFVRLAVSALGLGIVFVAIGLAISCFSKTRVQALVAALLMWCAAVFVFDLVALGVIVSTQVPAASEQIEVLCDTTHVNAMADIHSAYEAGSVKSAIDAEPAPQVHSLSWLAANPVDLFRMVNLSQAEGSIPTWQATAITIVWVISMLGIATWKLRRTDF